MKQIALTLIACVVLYASSAQAVEYAPEPTPVQQAMVVIAQITGRTWDTTDPDDVEKLTRNITRFANHWPSEFADYAVDPDNPTNADLAGFFVQQILTKFVRPVILSEAVDELDPTEQETNDAINNATGDIE